MNIVRWLGMGSVICGFLLITSMIGIAWYTFVHVVHEQDFMYNLLPCYPDAGCIGGWGEYGRLWDWLNPFFTTQPAYAYNLLVVQILAVIPQLWMVKKGWLSRNLVYLNIFTSFLFRAAYSAQDVTTTVFAPLGSVNPIFTLLLLFQKFGVGWTWNLSDGHWAYMVNLTGFEPFEWPYLLLMLWMFLPMAVWTKRTFFKNRFNLKIRMPRLRPEYENDNRALLPLIVALSLGAFYELDKFINGGYLPSICHPWELALEQFNQCTRLITLPDTGGANFTVFVVLLAGALLLGIIDVVIRLRRRK